VPIFTIAGCTTSQNTVAETINRLRLIDGVTNVTLLSSTKSTSGSGASGAGVCAGGSPAFNMTVTFDPLPTPSASESTVTAVANTAHAGSSPTGSAGAAR